MRIRYLTAMLLSCFIVPQAFAQDSATRTTPITFELDEEKLTIEADIPSVDLILSFREIQDRDQGLEKSFLGEIVESAKNEPF